MSASLVTKLRWFDQGAVSLAHLFRESCPELGSPAPPAYVCPLCMEVDPGVARFFDSRIPAPRC